MAVVKHWNNASLGAVGSLFLKTFVPQLLKAVVCAGPALSRGGLKASGAPSQLNHCVILCLCIFNARENLLLFN